MNLSMDFLHNGLPKRHLKTTFTPKQYKNPKLPKTISLNGQLAQLLSRPSLTSYEFISMQFDHEVQASSVIKPLQGKGRVNGDVTVFRPLLSSPKGVVLSQAYFPAYSDFDTYHMAAISIDTAIRNLVIAGADPSRIALLDNFCWCSSTDPERLGQLKRAAQACYDLATIYKAPFISGKDSMFNDFKGFTSDGVAIKISIPPTLLVSSIGVIDDSTKTISIDTKFPGDLVYVLGETYDEMGGSEYFRMLADNEQSTNWGERVPQVNAKRNSALYSVITKASQAGLVSSAISVGRGGLLTALAKMSIAGGLGLTVSLKALPGKNTRDDFSLFSESAGRIIVTVDPKNKTIFETLIAKVSHKLIGKVESAQVLNVINKSSQQVIELNLKDLEKAYKKTFKNY